MGPLAGVKVLEIAALGPAPFASMMLADMGADVLRIDRAERVVRDEHGGPPPLDFLSRGRRSVGLDLKRPEGVDLLLKLVESADVLVEGFRPGVMERLGVGPEVCLARNPRIVFGRMTGWGQQGPLARAAAVWLQPGRERKELVPLNRGLKELLSVAAKLGQPVVAGQQGGVGDRVGRSREEIGEPDGGPDGGRENGE